MKLITLLGLGIGFIAASIVLAQIHPFGNPRAIQQQASNVLLNGGGMPDGAKRVLVEKCANCHSNATSWPVYSKVAPVSWVIERDVIEGRDHFDLSQWQDLPPDRQQTLEQEIVHLARKGAMPPLMYRLVHRDSYLTQADVAALTALAPDNVEDTPAAPGDPVKGRAVFERRCTGCHALDSNREGPHLRGVYGRTAGTVPSFEYSEAVRKSAPVWNDANIERWLRGTDEMIPGNNMGFRVPKAQDRADIIAFLKTVQ